MVRHTRKPAHCTVHRAWSYLELPVGGEVARVRGAPVEAGVELHPVPGDPAPGPGPPRPQLGVAEEGAALRGHVVTPRLQAAA